MPINPKIKLSENNYIQQAQDIQDEIFRKMSLEERLKIALNLSKMAAKIAESNIKNEYPKADKEFLKKKLLERIINFDYGTRKNIKKNNSTS